MSYSSSNHSSGRSVKFRDLEDGAGDASGSQDLRPDERASQCTNQISRADSRHDLHAIVETYSHAQAMMAEWGDILGAAGSYERAHICGNVPYELGRVRHSAI